MKKIGKILQVVLSIVMTGVIAFWLIASIVKIGFESWQVALVLMQICSIFLVKVSINELKNEEL